MREHLPFLFCGVYTRQVRPASIKMPAGFVVVRGLYGLLSFERLYAYQIDVEYQHGVGLDVSLSVSVGH